MTSVIKDLLLIQSFDLSELIEKYRLFFLAILPSVFILAVIIEYFDRMEPLSLAKRALISILILTSITGIYSKSIDASMDMADEVLQTQSQDNLLLMDMFSGFKHWDKLNSDKNGQEFYKDRSAFWGTVAFLKFHLFDSFVNDGFTVTIFFITKLCFLILKVVYSLVYYLGYGLIGIPCLIYLFPSMGNVLRGALLSYLWCLVVPHVLVFVISMIGTEINKGYVSGQIIGGSMVGTALLFILTLFIAFTPMIAAMILNGSGISQAGGIIATIGANYVMNLPRNSLNTSASLLMGGPLGPKATLAKNIAKGGYVFAKGFKDKMPGFNKFSAGNVNTAHSNSDSSKVGNSKMLGQTVMSGALPPHTNDSDFVTLKNSNKRSGVDFISAPTRNNSIYQSTQMKNDSNNERSIKNGAVSKPGQGHRRDEKTTHHYRRREHGATPHYSRNRNIYRQKQYKGRVPPI